MRKAIELVISEIDLLLKCDNKDLFEEAMKMNLHFGVCFKLMREQYSKQVLDEVNHFGRIFISNNSKMFNENLVFNNNYWFLITCEPFMTNGNKILARESLLARKIVLEGILKTL